MSKRKLTSIILCALMAASVLSGCKAKETQTKTPDVKDEKITEIPLPITKDAMTINYWRANDAKVSASLKGFGDIAAYKKKEELTGIKVNFTHPPLGQQKDQFNLLIATNDLPEVIYYNWYDVNGGPEKLLADGRIIRLNEYIDKYAPNLKKLIDSDPIVKKQISLDDGTIYMFPYMRTDAVKLNGTAGLVLRKDWLDKLGLKAPTTIDDWYTVLKAFRENDPNGNGKKDELPYSGIYSAGNLKKLSDFAPAFGILSGFQLKDGKVAFGPIQPEYKEFLETMAKWYKEGLVDPEIMTNDTKAFDYKVTNNIVGAYQGGIFSGMGKYLDLMKTSNPQFNLAGVEWPKGKNGKSYNTFRLDSKVLTYGEAITSSVSKDKIKYIVQWMDFNYSQQGHELFNFGIEGESYTKSGNTIKFTDNIVKNPKGLTYDQALASYALSIIDGPMNQDGRYLDGLMQYQGQKDANAAWMKADYSLALPTTRTTEEEAKKIASVMGQVNTYIDEKMTKFIMGAEPISKFDEFANTIKGMGIEQVQKIYQDAYDRYQKR